MVNKVNEWRDMAAADPNILKQAESYGPMIQGQIARGYLARSLDGMKLDNLKLGDDKRELAELGLKFNPLPGVARPEISSPAQDSGKGGRT